MSENAPNQIEDAATLHKLMPNLAEQQRVENSVAHAESRGDRHVRANSERRIGAHLTRLTTLLQREGVEARVWDSAVEELVIKPEDVSEGYWEQQKQIARDNGLGDIHLGRREKEELTGQLQEAQRTGLNSWRKYLESTGNQYPVWFKFYAWDGMSRLGTFDKQKGIYSKRSKGTVAPYPQLNPAALAKVFEAVKGQGSDDEAVANLVKSGNFNKLYSHMLLDQKAVIPTPDKPEDVRGEWKEYSSDDVPAITKAAEGTPWCIAGQSFAESYTSNGGKFLLFHLQDPETGKISPTAAASVRLDGQGQVVELSGLKGGASQYVEDALVPTVQEKVKELPGGEKYLQAFEDKQMLIQMDRKFQKGEPFTHEELLFLYEVERPIRYIDTYAKDPRVTQFKRDKNKHAQQLAEYEGIDIKEAELIVISPEELETKLRQFLGKGYDPNVVAKKLTPKARFKYLDNLMEAGAQVDLNELYEQFETEEQLRVFSKLQERGANLDPDELAGKFSPSEKLRNYRALSEIGASITPNDIANEFSEQGRLNNLWDLSKIGAKVDVDGLLKKLKPIIKAGSLSLYLKEGAKLETIKDLFELDLSYHSSQLEDTARGLVAAGLSSDEIMSFLAGVKRKGSGSNPEGSLNDGDDSRERIQKLLNAGVEPDAILRSNVFDARLIQHDMATMLAAGADTNEIMKVIGAYFTGESIDELLKAGAQISDIVAHMQAEPKYILEHFEQLNERGANLAIEDVIASMDPNDVLYKIAKAKRLGATIDVNDLLDNPEVRYVYTHQIDDMLEAGASPQKIANKILPREVDYDIISGRWDSYRPSNLLRSEYPEIYQLVYDRVRSEVAAKAA